METNPDSRFEILDSTIHSLWIVIANYNGSRFLPDCLDALHNQTLAPAGIIVVDDASTDDSLILIKKQFPDVITVPLPKNVGFGAANNAGARVALHYGATHLILLNNDTKPAPDFLENLWQAFLQKPDAGAIGGALLFYDDPQKIQTAGIQILKNGGATDYLANAPVSILTQDIMEIFAPSAGCALISADVWKKTHGFDESYGMYLEDVDLGYKIRALGLKCYLATNAKALHHYSGTMVNHPFRKRWYWEVNRYRLMAKHFTVAQYINAQLNYFLTIWRRASEFKSPQGQKILQGRSKILTFIKMTLIFILAHCTGKLLYIKLKLT